MSLPSDFHQLKGSKNKISKIELGAFTLILNFSKTLFSGSKTRQYFGTTNFFGGPRVTNVGCSERLQALEIQSENSICVLSDVRMDVPSCQGLPIEINCNI